MHENKKESLPGERVALLLRMRALSNALLDGVETIEDEKLLRKYGFDDFLVKLYRAEDQLLRKLSENELRQLPQQYVEQINGSIIEHPSKAMIESGLFSQLTQSEK